MVVSGGICAMGHTLAVLTVILVVDRLVGLPISFGRLPSSSGSCLRSLCGSMQRLFRHVPLLRFSTMVFVIVVQSLILSIRLVTNCVRGMSLRHREQKLHLGLWAIPRMSKTLAAGRKTLRPLWGGETGVVTRLRHLLLRRPLCRRCCTWCPYQLMMCQVFELSMLLRNDGKLERNWGLVPDRQAFFMVPCVCRRLSFLSQRLTVRVSVALLIT